MTGGQPVDGPVSVHAIAHSVRAEGVSRIALVSDDPDKFEPADLPRGVTIHPREDLDAVQRELREISGVTVLIYEQTCATEKRRRRKRGQMEDPARFAFINDLVCEGCGDCSVASNCLSFEPKETPYGRKRKINLSTCNKDFSCLDGFCPSFVTVEGAKRRAKTSTGIDAVSRAAVLPSPALPGLDRPFDLLVTGVGGTGVVTIGALISMAAHLEGRGVSVLDFTGFAQKFGPVLSFVRIAASPAELHQVRIDQGAADALIGCDLVVSSSPKASGTYRAGTRAVMNTAEMPTGDVVRFRDADLAGKARLRSIERVLGAGNLATINANALAEKLLGDTVYANVMMLGFAWQQGLVPVSLEAMSRAIELNGVAVERNRQAFAWGRLLSADPSFVRGATDDTPEEPETLDGVIARRVAFLTAYQNASYAARYAATVARVRDAEAPLGSEALTDAVARSLFKLMSYKDEYEVARLHMETGFLDELQREFEGDFKVNYHLAPPLLPAKNDARGRPRKRSFGPWIQTPMKLLARLKVVRNTPFDIFGYTAERRTEKALIGWYEAQVERILRNLDAPHFTSLLAIAKAPMDIRGYGPVKEAAIHTVQAEVERLWSRLAEQPEVIDMRAREAAHA
jgi:indolepyruvate ferredoxin oxidoreductase